MDTKILKTIPGSENTEYVLAQIRDGYSVTLRDVDSGNNLPTFKIFKTTFEALAYIQDCLELEQPNATEYD